MPNNRLANAVNGLDPGSRALLDLSLRRRISDDEIAHLMRISPAEVARHRAGAIRQLGAELAIGRPEQITALLSAIATLPAEAWGMPAGRPPAPDVPPARVVEVASRRRRRGLRRITLAGVPITALGATVAMVIAAGGDETPLEQGQLPPGSGQARNPPATAPHGIDRLADRDRDPASERRARGDRDGGDGRSALDGAPLVASLSGAEAPRGTSAPLEPRSAPRSAPRRDDDRPRRRRRSGGERRGADSPGAPAPAPAPAPAQPQAPAAPPEDDAIQVGGRAPAGSDGRLPKPPKATKPPTPTWDGDDDDDDDDRDEGWDGGGGGGDDGDRGDDDGDDGRDRERGAGGKRGHGPKHFGDDKPGNGPKPFTDQKPGRGHRDGRDGKRKTHGSPAPDRGSHAPGERSDEPRGRGKKKRWR